MTTATLKALIATGFACCMAMPAAAQKHVALVLDNGVPQVSAPAQSTRIVEGLERLQYRVIFGRQQDQAGMRRYINDFRGQLKDAEVALVYYKGATLDSSGRNLLMVSNAAPGNPIEQNTVPLDEIADLMTASRANILLVDAGYSNSTAETIARSASGISQALAPIGSRNRFMVAFANTPGKIARSDAESPFAEVVASFLRSNELTSADLGRHLRSDVFDRTRGSQLPWVRSDLGSVQIAALPGTATPQPADAPESVPAVVRRQPPPVEVEAPPARRTTRERPAPRERAVERRRDRQERQASPRSGRSSEQEVRNTGVIGRGKGDFFAPNNPFYAPSR
jgi:uncharacterized caspase-like protein